MGDINKFQEENLIIGVLSTLNGIEPQLRSVLEEHFGPVDFSTDSLSFTYTSYYDGEMGEGIKRWFYSFRKTVQPSELSRIKILTNELEERWAVDGNRKVNLDPGLLDLNRLILATTKNVGHRIPLQNGIYAEVTLMYMKKDFHPLPWTYPDYQSGEYIAILKEIRTLYREKLKQH
ncbi:MAG: DUF4416 family protein [Spirochaetales bacterium]|uniref:DUF4416 family protein n=1 Tax=Candidatus Thalassospirochaeta sargassi TaxID=3119039 RepID=A0AAJ1MLW7_9SPIO|nr:DUF4416 family protein [Spirochaetales bacterium]